MRRVKKYVHLALLIAVAVLVLIGSYHYRYVGDWTRLGKHSLTPASKKILQNLSGPLEVNAYLARSHPARKHVASFIDRYKRHYSNIDLHFIDPASEPQRVRDNNIKEGELVLNYQNRQERVSKVIESSFSTALARLVRNEAQFIVFVTGHGERSPHRGANHDVSDWAKALTARGLNVQEINLSEVQAIPDNTSMLVIASPQLAYLPGELKLIAKYLASGGNLLWLSDPEEPAALRPLAEQLSIDKIPGTLVDPASLANGLDNPALLLATRYRGHESLAGFNLTTLFVYACAYTPRETSLFDTTTLVQSGNNAWSETSKLEGNVGFDEDQDLRGPLPIVLALKRAVEKRQQRIIVSGDGDFLANAYLSNAGNQDLGVRLVEWLVSADNMIDIPSRIAEDKELQFEKWQIGVIGFGFLVIIPGALILNGIVVWKRRNNA